MQIIVLDRQTGRKLAAFSRPGRMAGELKWVHNIASTVAATFSPPKSALAGACRGSGG